jgi:hypothetical protein
MTIEQIKKAARKDPMLDVAWDVLDTDPYVRDDFERVLNEMATVVPELEAQYTSLLDGTSGGEGSIRRALMFTTRQQLLTAYRVLDMWERYNMVNTLIALDSGSGSSYGTDTV